MNAPRTTVCTVDSFGGIDRRPCARPGDFDDLCGLAVTGGAAVETPPPLYRLDLPVDGDITPFTGGGAGWVLPDGSIWYRGSDTGENAGVAEGRRFTATLGTVTLFFPDKTWFDSSAGASGELEFTRASAADFMVTYDDEVVPPVIYVTGGEEPSVTPVGSAMWIHGGGAGGTPEAYRYYASGAAWVKQNTLHYRFAFTGAGAGIAKGQTLRVSGLTSTSGAVGNFIGSYRVYHSTANAVILTGAVNYRLLCDLWAAGATHFTVPEVKFERKVPDLAFAVAAGGRIWGASSDGSCVCASAASDPFTWNAFFGGPSDSCRIEVGAPGDFTGVSSRGSDPVFFKENAILRLRGSRPDNFELEHIAAPGVSHTSPRGVCRIGDGVYYAAPDGRIYRWAGGYPRPLSDPTGRAFSGVCVGGSGGTCVVSDGRRGYVYDVDADSWRRIDPAPVCVFDYGGAVYLVCPEGDGHALYRMGSGVDDDLGEGEAVIPEWSAATSRFAPDSGHGCVPAELLVDMESDGASPVKVGFVWDGEQRPLTDLRFRGRIRRAIALPQRNCSTVGVTLSGGGRFVLRSFAVRSAGRE